MADVTAWLQSWFSPTFLSPTKSFQSLCETALEILETGAVDEAGTFDDVLTQMAKASVLSILFNHYSMVYKTLAKKLESNKGENKQ